MEKFMHLILLLILIHFQYKSDFIWRNIIALLHYIYILFYVFILKHHWYLKTCFSYLKPIINIRKHVICILTLLLVIDNLWCLEIRHLYLKTCQSFFFNVLFILHNLVIGMHAILMGCFVVVCMRQTFPLNLRWIREYLIDRACT